MELSVIIVSYNVKYFLEQCLLSVIKAAAGIHTEIIVADNHSTDGSREYLLPKFPGVLFLWGNENEGFAKANNRALLKASGRHILFLNPDTIVPEDCFGSSLDFFSSHNDCGALGVRMIDGSGRFLPESKRSMPTAMSGFFKMTGLAKKFPRTKLFAGYYASRPAEKETGRVDILAGAFMMLSKVAVEKTKGFDEDFFMYGEDMDLSRRLLNSGLCNYYSGEITILHFKGESTGKGTTEHANQFYGAMKRFARKHYGQNVFRNAVIGVGHRIALWKTAQVRTNEPRSISGTTAIAGATPEQAAKISSAIPENKSYPVFFSSENEFSAGMAANPPANIVFCESGLGNKKIIALLQLLPENIAAFFYSANAGSIIGSQDKNSRGIFIAMNELHP